jgi:hypothetical protein
LIVTAKFLCCRISGQAWSNKAAMNFLKFGLKIILNYSCSKNEIKIEGYYCLLIVFFSINPLCPTGDHAYKLPKSQGVLAVIEYYSVLFGIGMHEPYGSLGNLSQLGT